MGLNWNEFHALKPRLLVGQQVRVVGEYASDYPEPQIIVGVWFDARKSLTHGWHYAIQSKEEIDDGCGWTDGFSEDDLIPHN